MTDQTSLEHVETSNVAETDNADNGMEQFTEELLQRPSHPSTQTSRRTECSDDGPDHDNNVTPVTERSCPSPESEQGSCPSSAPQPGVHSEDPGTNVSSSLIDEKVDVSQPDESGPQTTAEEISIGNEREQLRPTERKTRRHVPKTGGQNTVGYHRSGRADGRLRKQVKPPQRLS